MRQLLLIFFLMAMQICLSQEGRKREKSISGQRISRDAKTSPWIYVKTNPGPVQEGEMPKLFKWNITLNKRINSEIIQKQNKRRVKSRIRGNEVFHRKKYF